MEFRKPSRKKVQEVAELIEMGRNARLIFHDLSNHLTSLSLSVDQLKSRTNQTQNQIEYVSELLKKHLSRSGHCKIRLAQEIRNVCAGFASRFQQAKIQVDSKLQRGLVLRGDKKAFTHILTNLLSNATDSFTTVPWRENKTICIRVVCERRSLVLSVSDNGCGITPANIGRIFEENFTTKKTGHGIGLFAVKEYVEEIFGGQIEVKSSPDGTKFIVHFPLKTEAPGTRTKPRTNQAGSKRLVRELKNRRQDLIQQKAFRGFQSRELFVAQDL